MASNKYKEMQQDPKAGAGSDMPKHKQLIQMLSFRVVPAYYKEIEILKDNSEQYDKLHKCINDMRKKMAIKVIGFFILILFLFFNII